MIRFLVYISPLGGYIGAAGHALAQRKQACYSKKGEGRARGDRTQQTRGREGTWWERDRKLLGMRRRERGVHARLRRL